MKVPSEDQKRRLLSLINIKDQEILKSAEKKMNESLAQWIKETRDVLLKNKNDPSQAWKELSDETVIICEGRHSQTENGTWLASGKIPQVIHMNKAFRCKATWWNINRVFL